MPTLFSDRDWEVLGRSEPYWAVYTHDCFRGQNLTANTLQDFFATGEEYWQRMFATIRQHVDGDFQPTSALDYGCGVGRLAIPLAQRGVAVTGVDIADSMLRQARAHCQRLGLHQVRLVKADDALSNVQGQNVEGRFSLVHSFIVFQHIPPERGDAILRGLVDRLQDNGIGILHFTYAKDRQRFPRRPWWQRLARAGWRSIRKVAKSLGREFGPPDIPMHDYSLNRIFSRLCAAGVRRLHVEFTDHGGCLGAILVFQKTPGEGHRF